MKRANRAAPLSSRPPLQERSKATVDAILAAAARIVARDGYAKARMADIAERAGVSVGSIYQYFPSKDVLVTALIRAHVQRGWEVFLVRIQQLGALSLHEAVRALVACAVDVYRVDPKLFKVIFEQIPRERVSAGLPDFNERLVSTLSEYLASRPELLRRRRLPLALRILVTTVIEVIASATAADPTLAERDALIDELADLVIRYLLIDPP